MPAVSFQALAQMSMERLLNCLAEGVVIAGFAWLLLRLAGRKNSRTRFVVWFCALIAIAVAPFVSFASAGGIAHDTGAAFTIPDSWALYLFGAWAFIATIGVARVAFGLWHLYSVRKKCVPVATSTLDPLVAITLGEFRTGRSVQLLSSEKVRVPTAMGFFRPAVIVPAWALRELSVAELNAVLLHELAHVRRWDDWTNLAQKVLRAVFFFHPAVWWVESRLSLEREMACDDLVLTRTSNPRAYAECLVSLAEKNLLQRGIALAQAAVGRMRQTSLRVLQILDARRPQSVKVWQPGPWVVAGFSVVCLAAAAHAPRLVAFGDPEAGATRQIQSATFASREPSYVAPVVAAKFVAAEGTGATHLKTRKTTSPSKSAILRPAHRSPVPSGNPATKPDSAPAVRMPQPQAPSAARVVQASFAQSSSLVVMQETVYVFVQNPALGGAPIVWKVSVWQLQLSPEMPAGLAPKHPSKSI
ncbi:MAG TPA: M56 family metallopeptidase [Terriglobales bacterium]|nr:M56 family metallopeptidase [Terriglobales bacterium]